MRAHKIIVNFRLICFHVGSSWQFLSSSCLVKTKRKFVMPAVLRSERGRRRWKIILPKWKRSRNSFCPETNLLTEKWKSKKTLRLRSPLITSKIKIQNYRRRKIESKLVSVILMISQKTKMPSPNTKMNLQYLQWILTKPNCIRYINSKNEIICCTEWPLPA